MDYSTSMDYLKSTKTSGESFFYVQKNQMRSIFKPQRGPYEDKHTSITSNRCVSEENMSKNYKLGDKNSNSYTVRRGEASQVIET